LQRVTFLLASYLVGVVWGLLRIDAKPPVRLALALLWPIGPVAFVVTLTILLAVSLVAFPRVGVAAVAAGGVLWWVFS
jgi:hypothetical protein